jgi:hypothetical protein
MPDTADELARQNAALTRQLLEWIGTAPRTYAETIETWRSSCPRHTIWEDALIAGLVDHSGGAAGLVTLTASGKALLAAPTR